MHALTDEQLLKINHSRYVCGFVRMLIDILDASRQTDSEMCGEGPDEDYDHITLGSKQRPQTMGDLEDATSTDPAFTRFHTRLGDWLSGFLQACGIPLPNGKWIKFLLGYKVHEPND
jgi:hypothetical protein